MSEHYCPECGSSLTSADVHGRCGACPVCGLSMCGGWPRRDMPPSGASQASKMTADAATVVAVGTAALVLLTQ